MTSDRVRRYVMIGAPVTSVRTPPLLEAFLRDAGVTAAVPVRHLEPAALPAFMAELRADRSIDGLMVTMPHKRAIVPHLDGLSAVAARVGSVNAVKRVGDRLLGAQFDGIGLRNAVLGAGVDLAASRVWLKGIGGAGLAIGAALLAHGVAALFVSEIDEAMAAAAAPVLGGAVFSGPHDESPAADVLVNATPVGMARDDPTPFTEGEVAAARLVADIVADPNETRLAGLAAAAGVPLVTGRQMVASQVPPIGRWLLSDALEQGD